MKTNDIIVQCKHTHSPPSGSSSEHFSYSHGEYGSLHAKPLQQQNMVSVLLHVYVTQLESVLYFSCGLFF